MGGWVAREGKGRDGEEEDWLGGCCCCKSLCGGMGGILKAGERRLVIPNRVVGV